jgi:F-type H+-transporting ATPase subunit b
MELVTPGIGLLFWMLLMFGVVLWILKKFAWKPILNALKNREYSIQEALMRAETARKEMKSLKEDNEKIVAEARTERVQILKDAKNVKEEIIILAKEQAKEEGKKMINEAKEDIKNEKDFAIEEIRKQVTELSIDIAEKILREKLEDKGNQKELIDKWMKDIKLN